MPKILARTPGAGTAIGRQHAGQAAVAEGGQVGRGKFRMRGNAYRLVRPAAKECCAFPFQEFQRLAGVGPVVGEQGGTGDQHGQEPRAEAARPKERHRDVEALVLTHAASVQPGSGRPQARCHDVWMTPLGVPLLPEVNRMTIGSAGRTVLPSASTTAASTGSSGRASAGQTRCN